MEWVQLELDLFHGEPWSGKSPRALTRGHLAFIFNARAEEVRTLFCDLQQLELWPAKLKGLVTAPSAPTLLPLPVRS